jgi:hypothetical protein
MSALLSSDDFFPLDSNIPTRPLILKSDQFQITSPGIELDANGQSVDDGIEVCPRLYEPVVDTHALVKPRLDATD